MSILVDSFIKVANKFLEVLAHENEMLEQQDLGDVSDLVQQKQMVAGQYELLAEKLLLAFPGEEIVEPQREELQTVVHALSERLKENEQMLTIALKSNEKILDVIVRSFKKKGTPNCYYTKAGNFRRNQTTISMISLDTKL
ncbi:flagellar export chaperone FlgN [Candidatus Paracaedibacter symbiosus]|uniref:flagellar export chaperone FlgN n=1 Tax=Candidatus Paracaedibacter symbiosus TaxID=244582 RepID=UPI000509BECF|nr:flagellar export chaperone FlgN [Candidatus Paracaedibacter symbiosus]